MFIPEMRVEGHSVRDGSDQLVDCVRIVNEFMSSQAADCVPETCCEGKDKVLHSVLWNISENWMIKFSVCAEESQAIDMACQLQEYVGPQWNQEQSAFEECSFILGSNISIVTQE